MAIIRIDLDGLRSRANAMEGHIAEYESLNRQMQSLSGDMTTTWKGASGSAYSSMMSGYVSQAQSLVQILRKFENYATDAAEKFEVADAECVGRIRNSF